MHPQRDPAQEMLDAILRDEAPAHYLVIGDPTPLDPASGAPGTTTLARMSLEEAREGLDNHGRQDLVLVGGLEGLPRNDGEVLLSRLRDLYARRVLVRLVPGASWQNNDLTAFGFTRLATLPADGGVLFGFDIGTYKTTPDWLNPRYWANPELWGKYRW